MILKVNNNYETYKKTPHRVQDSQKTGMILITPNEVFIINTQETLQNVFIKIEIYK